ncbi:Major facilitator superfamily MFS_1 [uncultured Desulfobacterium sp.]|uniref:Major facilitator superfamily MFS_1 n=1 Tax=uncultured Desulfobacterium sp. TaxID=201089 RepID=A0A445MUX3_9BACT|nr:Major facilitator superfamily MFS_1 [uncultured Desulfobacterium sp.]
MFNEYFKRGDEACGQDLGSEGRAHGNNRHDLVNNSSFRADWMPAILLGTYTVTTAIMYFFIVVFFKEELKFSALQIGILFSIQAVTGILASFPAGMGNDRFSSRTLIASGLLSQAVCFFLMSVITSFVPFAIVFTSWSMFSWVFRLSIDVYFLKSNDKDAIGRRIGFFQAWRFIGMTAGTVFAGYLVSGLDFKMSFRVIGLICLGLSFLAGLMPVTATSLVRLADYRADFVNKRVLLFAAWMLLFATHWGAEQTSYGLFLRKDLGLSFSGMGLYISAEYIVIVLTLLFLGGTIAGGKNFRRFAVWGLVASGIGHMGMVIKPVYISLMFRMIHGLGDGLIILVQYYGISKLFSLEHLGGNTGLISLVLMIGYCIGAMIYSPIGETFGYGYPLCISGLLTILLIAPLLHHRPSARSIN